MSKLIQPRKIKRRPVKNRIEEILELSKNKKVLHFGCADYPFTKLRGDQLLHYQLSKVSAELHGIDASEKGINDLKELGFKNLFLVNAESPTGTVRDQNYDVIIAGEIIEHLSNPGLFLDSLRTLMSEETELILTTINAFTLKIFLYSFFYKEKVHSDHNYYFSYYTIKQLIEKHGLKCDNIYYYQEVNGKGLSLILDRLFYVMSLIFPSLSDGLIVKIKKA